MKSKRQQVLLLFFAGLLLASIVWEGTIIPDIAAQSSSETLSPLSDVSKEDGWWKDRSVAQTVVPLTPTPTNTPTDTPTKTKTPTDTPTDTPTEEVADEPADTPTKPSVVNIPTPVPPPPNYAATNTAMTATALERQRQQAEAATAAARQAATQTAEAEATLTAQAEATAAEAARQTAEAADATQTAAAAMVSVPNVTGTDSGSAESALYASGLVANTTFGGTGCNPYMVVSQNPQAGIQVSRGSSVTIQVCPGVTVPNVVGIDKDAASAELSNAGLVPSLVSYCDGDKPDGQVWSTEPGPGESVSPGTVVTVNYYTGCSVEPGGGGGGGGQGEVDKKP